MREQKDIKREVRGKVRHFHERGVDDELLRELDVHFEMACEKYPKYAWVEISITESGDVVFGGAK